MAAGGGRHFAVQGVVTVFFRIVRGCRLKLGVRASVWPRCLHTGNTERAEVVEKKRQVLPEIGACGFWSGTRLGMKHPSGSTADAWEFLPSRGLRSAMRFTR